MNSNSEDFSEALSYIAEEDRDKLPLVVQLYGDNFSGLLDEIIRNPEFIKDLMKPLNLPDPTPLFDEQKHEFLRMLKRQTKFWTLGTIKKLKSETDGHLAKLDATLNSIIAYRELHRDYSILLLSVFRELRDRSKEIPFFPLEEVYLQVEKELLEQIAAYTVNVEEIRTTLVELHEIAERITKQ